MNNTIENKKINARDLGTIAIFTVIYFAILALIAVTGASTPITSIFWGATVAFLAGIPMILFISKITKFGMFTIFTVIQGAINSAMGFGIEAIIGGLIIGLVADFILKAGKYQSFKASVISYAVFSQWIIVPMMPMFILNYEFVEPHREAQGDAYVDAIGPLLAADWIIPALIVAIAIGASLGALLSDIVLKKHLKKAGIV